jgi:hypothetical protein
VKNVKINIICGTKKKMYYLKKSPLSEVLSAGSGLLIVNYEHNHDRGWFEPKFVEFEI